MAQKRQAGVVSSGGGAAGGGADWDRGGVGVAGGVSAGSRSPPTRWLRSLVLRDEAHARCRIGRALYERRLDRRRQRPLGAETKGRTGSIQLEGAERLLVEIAVLTT